MRLFHGPKGVEAGVYLKPDGSLAPGQVGAYTIYAIDQREVANAAKRTKARRSRLAKLDGQVDRQKDIVGGRGHAGAIPMTHMIVMRQIDPAWPKGDDRLLPALESGNIRIHYLKPGEVILGPKGVGAMVGQDGQVVRVRDSRSMKPKSAPKEELVDG